jgi:heme oxygenase (biliverdin-IX-beta and delta-forming)
MTFPTACATDEFLGVLDRLRADTRSLHARVEKRVDLAHRCATKDAYRGLLVQMFGVHAAIEAVLARLDWTSVGIDLAQRRKTHHIRADLALLDGQEVGPPPLCNDVPQLRTLAEGFGCLYVVEGSTLGGQVIVRHLRQSLDLSPGNGASFFASYGPEVGSMWRAFGDAAKSHCTTEDRIREAVDSAISTFEFFEMELQTRS